MTFHPRPQPHRLGPYSGDADDSLPQITNDADEMLQILFEDIEALDAKVDANAVTAAAGLATVSGGGSRGPQGVDGPDGDDNALTLTPSAVLTIPIPTQGSVLFGGPSGAIAQDNANFFYDATNKRLGVGTQPFHAFDVYADTSSDKVIAGYGDFLSTNPLLYVERRNGAIAFNSRNFHDFVIIHQEVLGTIHEHVRFVSDGKVGIGTSTPEALLEIQGAEATDASLCLDADDGDDSADTWFVTSVAATNNLDFVNHTSTRFSIMANGNTGVGTSTPAGIFEVSAGSPALYFTDTGTSYVQVAVRNNNAALYYGIDNAAGGALISGSAANSAVFNQANAYPFHFGTSNVIRLTILANGNLEVAKTISSYNGVATEGYGVPAIVDSVALTAQTADIGSTNVTNANVAGQYEVSYYLEATTADVTAGTVTVTFSFTDGAGATTVASSALVLSATGRTSGQFPVHLASGSLSYSIAHTGIFGTSAYALYITTKRLS